MNIDRDTGQSALRPLYHFTPAANWINDPNGLVYYAGEYHLFYQYHPDSTLWGPMHWGHAVSSDLVQWEELPIALYPDELGAIFSGSAVIDWHDTAGFGKEAMVAIFTHDHPTGQSQSIAYSHDNGRTWTKYASNPVIETQPNEKDFRDPKVFWYGEKDGGHWVMLLAVADSIWFYTSPDLKTWTFSSEFGEDAGSHAGVWETPDLFALPIEGSSERRWVLTVGIGAGAQVTEQCTQYFVGDFDGRSFVNINPPETILRADGGPDFYAAQGWNDAPDGRKIWIAWMNNWIYAREIPTGTWRGLMSLPREVALCRTAEGIRLTQKPVAIAPLLRDSQRSWPMQQIHGEWAPLGDSLVAAIELIAEFQLDVATTATRFGCRVGTGDQITTTIYYDIDTQQLAVDRTQSAATAFHPEFSGVYCAPLSPQNGMLRLHLLLDRCTVELFGNDGLAAITALIFPDEACQRITFFSEGGSVTLRSLIINYAIC